MLHLLAADATDCLGSFALIEPIDLVALFPLRRALLAFGSGKTSIATFRARQHDGHGRVAEQVPATHLHPVCIRYRGCSCQAPARTKRLAEAALCCLSHMRAAGLVATME